MADWYYYNESGEKVGLVTGSEIKALASQGVITPETKIENRGGHSGQTLLHVAACENDIEACRTLITVGGADVNAKDSQEGTPLYNAANYGNLDVCKFLIDAGASVNVKYKPGFDPNNRITLLGMSAGRGYLNICRLLIDAGADVNTTTGEWDSGVTPLHFAALKCHLEVCRLLIDAGANINAKTKDGKTPLRWAEKEEVRQLLIAASNTVRSTIVNRVKKPNAASTNSAPKEVRTLADAIEADDIGQVESFFEQGVSLDVFYGTGSGISDLLADVLLHNPPRRAIFDFLIQRGLDVKKRLTVTGQTLLHVAASENHADACRMLVAAGAAVNAKDKGRTPLSNAICNGRSDSHLDVCEFLIDNGADVNVKNDGDSLLHSAARNNHLAICKRLIAAGVKTDTKDNNGSIPLHRAAERGHAAVCKLLITNGRARYGEVNAKNDEKYTPLHCAAEEGYPDVCEILITAGADISSTTSSNMTPLYYAVKRNRLAVCKILIPAAGEKIKDLACDVPLKKLLLHSALNEPFLYAAENGYAEICKLFIAAGAQVKSPSAYYDDADIESYRKRMDETHGVLSKRTLGTGPKFPLTCAARNGHVEVCKLLIAAGADVNEPWSFSTPLHEAARNGHVEVCDALIDANADVNANALLADRTDCSMTPLLCAARGGHFNVCQSLIYAGANVNARDRLQTTPLHFGARRLEICQLLLNAGAAVNAMTYDGKTPLMWAKTEEIRQLLIAAGGQE